MSVELVIPAGMEEEMVVEVSERDLLKLVADLEAAVSATNAALATLDGIIGENPTPHPTAAHLRTVMNMGAGYYRHAETTLRRLFRARNEAIRAANKER
jgi:ABC-type transporter Mla subunit MlaD